MGARRVPNLFTVGAPKSGPTSMYEYLKGGLAETDHPARTMVAGARPFEGT